MTCAAGCHVVSRTPAACHRSSRREHDREGVATRQLRTLRAGRGNRRLNHAVHMGYAHRNAGSVTLMFAVAQRVTDSGRWPPALFARMLAQRR
jgi:hypothetical protein